MSNKGRLVKCPNLERKNFLSRCIPISFNIQMTIIVCFVLIVGFYSVYLFSEFNYIVEELEINEKIENEFFLQDFGDKNKIFIVGSSHIRPLDPQYIEKELSEKNLDFQVFNLSIMGDTPLKRIKSIEKIASTKPELVLYGVGFRDFSKIENLKPDALDFFPTKSSDKILPDIREILMDEFQLEDYYSKKFGMLKSPKYYSFSLIQNLGQNNKNVKEVSNREFSYHLPFNNHASSKTTIPISELENRVNSDSWTNFDENNVNFEKDGNDIIGTFKIEDNVKEETNEEVNRWQKLAGL